MSEAVARLASSLDWYANLVHLATIGLASSVAGLKLVSKDSKMNTLALTFQATQFDIVDRNSQPWLRLHQIGAALGYSRPDAVNKIYQSNADEFTDTMTALVELETEGGKQQVRVFSLRGCHLLAMLSRTKIAKEFRKWVLDILDNQSFGNTEQRPEAKTKKALVGGLSLDQQDTIKALVNGRAEGQPKEKQARIIIQGWSAIKKKFELSKTQTYKNIEPENFVNIISLITRLPIDGELVEKSAIPTDTIAVSLNGATRSMTIIFNGKNDNATQDYLVKVAQDFISVQALNDNEQVKSQEQFMTALLEDDYIVMKKAELLGRLQA